MKDVIIFNEVDEMDLREDWANGVPLQIIAKEFGVCAKTIIKQAKKLGLPIKRGRPPVVFNETDLKDLRDDWEKGTRFDDIADEFQVSRRTLSYHIKQMRLPPRRRYLGDRPWTDSEDVFLLLHYNKMPNRIVGEMMFRSKNSVISRANRLFEKYRRSFSLAA